MASGGKGGGGSAPKPPDPKYSAMSQYLANLASAREQQKMNATDYVTPYGSIVNQNLGDGRWQQNVILSPEQQFLLDQQNALSANMNQQAADTLGNLSTGRYEDAVYDQYTSRLDPRFAQQQSSLEQDLANRGIKIGSAAYDRAMQNFEMGRNDAYDQATRGAITTGLGARNQLVNEALALSGRGQPQSMSAPGLPSTGMQAPDIQGAIQQQYQGQLANWQNQQQQSASGLGALFSLGGQALGGWASSGFALPSDRRVKKDVRRVGTTPGGYPLYSFRYVWGGPEHIGVMADEVMMRDPEAVTERGGIQHVDYSRIH